eukprot:356056-Chlamydomonas_euryale.AAC.3
MYSGDLCCDELALALAQQRWLPCMDPTDGHILVWRRLMRCRPDHISNQHAGSGSSGRRSLAGTVAGRALLGPPAANPPPPTHFPPSRARRLPLLRVSRSFAPHAPAVFPLHMLPAAFPILRALRFCAVPCRAAAQEEVMEFVNSIARIVHSAVARHGGAANKNIGDAFLLVRVGQAWKHGSVEAWKRESMRPGALLMAVVLVLVAARVWYAMVLLLAVLFVAIAAAFLALLVPVECC